MKFNPITKEVFTDNNEFIKKMHCPCGMTWSDLEPIDKSSSKKCSTCNQSIIDTEFLTDTEVLSLVIKHPQTCLKIDLNQKNIRLLAHGILEQT